MTKIKEVIKIKNKKMIYSVSILLLLAIGFSFGMLNSSPLIIQNGEDFDSPKSSAGEITIATPENKTYTEPDNGYYPATYGFENDPDGSNPEDWVIWDEDDIIEIIPELDGHKKVLRLYDSSTSSQNHIQREFSAKDHGQMEFWTRTTDINDHTTFDIRVDDVIRLFMFGINNGNFYREDGSGTTIITSALNDYWYHIRIVFRGSYGINYEGLTSNYTWKVFIDDVEYGNYTFVNNQDVEWFRPSTADSGASNVNFYVDAVGFSWDPHYVIGDNLNEGLLLSYKNTTTLDWEGYSLDGANNKTIIGNTTIPLPSEGTHQIQIFGNDTMDTMFESNLRYFTIDTSPYIGLCSPENKTYTQPDSGYYPATYGFENDLEGADPEDWVIFDEGGIIEVTDEIGSHKKVLRLYDPSTSSQNHIQKEFSAKDHGQIEFWMRTTDITDHTVLDIRQSAATRLFMVGIYDSNLYVEDGVSSQTLTSASSNIWYHVLIVFRGSYGTSFGGLTSTYTWKVLIGGIEYGIFTYINNQDVEIFRATTANVGASNVDFYIDAVGFSWDSDYTIADNSNEGLLLSFDSNIELNWTSFSLDGSNNRTILGNTTIPMPSDGLHRIQVFGNNSVGTIYESDVKYFTIAVNPPEITINTPTPSQTIGSMAPVYDITITGLYDSIWYTLDGGATNITASSITGTINQAAWAALADGIITIKFYANGPAGVEGNSQVMVIKDTSEEPPPTPPGIPGYDLYLLIGAISIISALLLRKRMKS